MRIKKMVKPETRDKNFRDVIGELAGVYGDRMLGTNKMAQSPAGWGWKVKEAGVPFGTVVDWVAEATAAGQRCNCPLVEEHILAQKFSAWQASQGA
jgi:hypothetical protein